MKLLVTGRDNPMAGIMIPVPVYPLYTAVLAEFNTYPVRLLLRTACQYFSYLITEQILYLIILFVALCRVSPIFSTLTI